MTSFQSTIQADAPYFVLATAPIDSSAVAGSFLVVFCLFFLIASVVHRRDQRDAEQLEADREFLEHIWQMNSNLER
ncbi:hypothetical protein ACQ4M3_23975 [Leptolyngbya sp. AN03gr2]|uniref:hypothetical protein n=1 Tax=unclassified Leptolyngbya TaxID=2650499 RepID=UPI003D31F118